MTPNLITSLLGGTPDRASLLNPAGRPAGSVEAAGAEAAFAQLMQGELAALEAGADTSSDAAGAVAAALLPPTDPNGTTAPDADSALPPLPPAAATGDRPLTAAPAPAATVPGTLATGETPVIDDAWTGERPVAALDRGRTPVSTTPAGIAQDARSGENTAHGSADRASLAAEFTVELGQAVRRAVTADSASAGDRLAAAGSQGPGASGQSTPASTSPALAPAAPVSAAAELESPLPGVSRMDLTQPFATDAWEQELGMRLNWMADSRVGRAELRLNPPELGPLEVSLNVSSEEVSVSFQAQHAATREAVENALPRLREMMAQNGLTLADANVSQHSRQDSDGGQSRERQAAHTSGDEVASGETRREASPVSIARTTVGLLDTYA